MNFLRVVVLGALVMLSGCSRSSVAVFVTNESSTTVSNVVISGSGFTNQLANVVPGARHLLRVSPRGESGLQITFDALGRRFDSGKQGYFESGNRVLAVIGTNLNVSVSSE